MMVLPTPEIAGEQQERIAPPQAEDQRFEGAPMRAALEEELRDPVSG